MIRTTGAELVITLGAMADAVPHTRPPLVKGSSTTAALAARLGLDRPSYQGPTGLIGVLHDRLDRERHPGDLAAGGGAPLRRLLPQPQGHAGAAAAPAST